MFVVLQLVLLFVVPLFALFYRRFLFSIFIGFIYLGSCVFLLEHDELFFLKKDNVLITLFNLLFTTNFSLLLLLVFIFFFFSKLLIGYRQQTLQICNRNKFIFLFFFFFCFCFFFTHFNVFYSELFSFSSEPLNTMLTNPMMVIHPLLLYLGYGAILVLGFLFFFFFKYSESIRIRIFFFKFLFFILLVLGFSLLFSIVWSWDLNSLSWTWDPIESLLLIIFLFGVILLHRLFYDKQKISDSWHQLELLKLVWLLPLFSFILVRNSVLDSIHSFTEDSFMLLLFITMPFCIFFSLSNGFSYIRSFRNIFSLSIVPLTLLFFFLVEIILAIHTFYPNFLGGRLDPDVYETLTILPVFLGLAMIIFVVPIALTIKKNIMYLPYVILGGLLIAKNFDLFNFLVSITFTGLACNLDKFKSFKFTHLLLLIIGICIATTILFNWQQDIKLIPGQYMLISDHQILLQDRQLALKKGDYNQIIHVINANIYKTSTIEIVIQAPEQENIAKSRMYLSLLNQTNQVLNTVIKKNQLFIKLTEIYTPLKALTLTICTLIIIKNIKNKKYKLNKIR